VALLQLCFAVVLVEVARGHVVGAHLAQLADAVLHACVPHNALAELAQELCAESHVAHNHVCTRCTLSPKTLQVSELCTRLSNSAAWCSARLHCASAAEHALRAESARAHNAACHSVVQRRWLKRRTRDAVALGLPAVDVVRLAERGHALRDDAEELLLARQVLRDLVSHQVVAREVCLEHRVRAVRPALQQLWKHVVAVLCAADALLQRCAACAQGVHCRECAPQRLRRRRCVHRPYTRTAL
jgi:hypothetical protein